MEAAIAIEDLGKQFQVKQRAPGFGGALRHLFWPDTHSVVALRDVSFRIERGERVAFVGPNGAGKSTTIKILAGILHPSSGSARVLGHVPWQDRKGLSYRIGTVFGQRSQLWYHLPAADSFALLMHIYDQEPTAHARRRDALVEAFDLGPHMHKPVRQLSLGERMRCEIVASLLHSPELLFLDEPTIGLDVGAKATIRELLRDESARYGRTLLLTSHDTGDMEQVCDRVIVIHQGQVLLDRSVSALRSGYIRQKRIALQTVEAEVTVALPGVRVVRSAPHRLELEIEVDITPIENVVQAVLANNRVQDITVEDPPMDEIVQAIYQRAAHTLRDAQASPPIAEVTP